VRLQLKPHWVINGAIVLLVLAVVLLTGNLAWNSFRDYRDANLVIQSNRMADFLVTATEDLAVERGLTAAALGAQNHPDMALRDQLIGRRQHSDEHWRDAMTLAEALPHSNTGFTNALTEVRAARRDFEQARLQVDRKLGGEANSIGVDTWIRISTRLIEASVKLGDVALLESIIPRDLTKEIALRKTAWRVSEYAGRERGIFAFYVSARTPVPKNTQDQLKLFRGTLLVEIENLRRQWRAADIDPQITSALSDMEHHFLARFEPIRNEVYAQVNSGTYPIGGFEWVRQATGAIDSILAVTKAITGITEQKVAQIKRRSLWQLGGGLGLFLATLGLTLVSITRVRQTVNDLFYQKELAEVTMDSIGDAVITTDAQGVVEYLNPIAEELTGWSNAEAHGQPLKQVFNLVNGYTREPKDNPIERCLREQRIVGLGNEAVLVRRDGVESAIEDSAAPIRDRDDRVVGAVMVFYDVSSMRSQAHMLSYHATHDTLTGLANRREFERRLEMLLAESKARGMEHALCYLDLDQFKVINDTCGHSVGDKMLRQLTAHLKTRVRGTDTLARLGGDEFGLLLHGCALERAVEVAESLRLIIKDFRFSWEDKVFDIGVSMGVVPITVDSTSPEQILGSADAACYAAKEKGRNRVQVYKPDNVEFARRHGEMEWISRITEALENDRFRLYCQAIKPLTPEGEPHHEILLRLQDEDGELILPGAFIPAAERYNLMPQVDRWVMRNAFAALQECRARLGPECRLVCNINVSGVSLGETDFLNFIQRQLKENDLPPEAICFEITETTAVTNIDHATAFVRALKQLGCRFALDDFGTGICSFGYLKELQVDYLKIGGTFVKDMVNEATAYATVQAIHAVGRSLGIRTVAEHVSSEEILKMITELGVDYVQGFAVGMPCPVSECIAAATAAKET